MCAPIVRAPIVRAPMVDAAAAASREPRLAGRNRRRYALEFEPR
jgi:hypothetical protein